MLGAGGGGRWGCCFVFLFVFLRGGRNAACVCLVCVSGGVPLGGRVAAFVVKPNSSVRLAPLGAVCVL